MPSSPTTPAPPPPLLSSPNLPGSHRRIHSPDRLKSTFFLPLVVFQIIPPRPPATAVPWDLAPPIPPNRPCRPLRRSLARTTIDCALRQRFLKQSLLVSWEKPNGRGVDGRRRWDRRKRPAHAPDPANRTNRIRDLPPALRNRVRAGLRSSCRCSVLYLFD